MSARIPSQPPNNTAVEAIPVRSSTGTPIIVRLRGFRIVLYIGQDDCLLDRDEAAKLHAQLGAALDTTTELEAIRKRLEAGGWIA